jgi:hypothetical protein
MGNQKNRDRRPAAAADCTLGIWRLAENKPELEGERVSELAKEPMQSNKIRSGDEQLLATAWRTLTPVPGPSTSSLLAGSPIV